MPLEIKELYIKVTVNQPSQETAAPQPQAALAGSPPDKEEIIHQCVEEVLSILRRKKER